MIRRPPRSTLSSSSAASDVYKRQDVDPLASLYGRHAAVGEAIDMEQRWVSELVGGAKLGWSKIRAREPNVVVTWEQVDWNGLIQATSSMEVLEWQGWLRGHFMVHVQGVYHVHCTPLHTVLVDKLRISTDQYGRGLSKGTVTLAPGVHSLAFRLRSKGPQASFRCEIQKVKPEVVFELEPVWIVPDVVLGELVGGGWVSIPVRNTGSEWLDRLEITELSGSVDSVTVEFHSIAPGQVLLVPVRLHLKRPLPQTDKILLTLEVRANQYKARVKLRLQGRSVEQSFKYTFVDHDGSVQSAAAVRPAPGSNCSVPVSYTHLRAHETPEHLVCRLLLEKKKNI
eukprot:TRINITY_DN21132_c0_g1_i3.p1 TRINITY_DN21132_c0_g1~~TRINITY_DN21132_c0_g1_i3.p1  ORF type:complete len:340 (+),score=74.44 TRINITY_DN21132_c0_g1_i3:97-1116(+)